MPLQIRDFQLLDESYNDILIRIDINSTINIMIIEIFIMKRQDSMIETKTVVKQML